MFMYNNYNSWFVLTRSFSDNLNSDGGKFNTGRVELKYVYIKELVQNYTI